MSDRRAVLEAIAFAPDPKISPTDRLRALELLAAEVGSPISDDGSSEAQILADIDDFHSMTLVTMFVASGPETDIDPAQFPKTAQALRSIVGRMTELALGAREIATEQDSGD